MQQVITRSFTTFEEILEVIEAIEKRNVNVRIYLQKEVFEAANEVAMEEINNGIFKATPIIFAWNTFMEESLVKSLITPKKEFIFDVETEPAGEYHLRLEQVVPYGDPY